MHDGRAGEASQRVLVHEALSHVVHHEAGVARVRLVAGKVGAAEHDVVGLLLPGAAHPKLHFVAFQLAVVNVERVSCGRGEHRVAFFVFRTRLDGGLDAGLGRDVDDPVDGLLGVVVELVPQSRFEVAAVGEVLLAVEPRGIHAGDAHLFHDLRIHAVVGSAAAHRSLRRADERHLQSVFSA